MSRIALIRPWVSIDVMAMGCSSRELTVDDNKSRKSIVWTLLAWSYQLFKNGRGSIVSVAASSPASGEHSHKISKHNPTLRLVHQCSSILVALAPHFQLAIEHSIFNNLYIKPR
jgi:hypothetical protein